MAHDIRIISVKDFVRTDVTGAPDLAASEKLLKEIAAACQGTPQHHVLIDVRQAERSLSVMDVFQLACSLRDIGLGVHNRIAVLAPPAADFDRARFFETVARNRGCSVGAFRDFEKAFDWLAET
jgi:hypothetical protein